MTENIEFEPMTDEWLDKEKEISMNRRLRIGELFDSAFLSPDARELRKIHDPRLAESRLQSDDTNHNEIIQKKEI